jgi:uncharacterized protein
MKVRVVIKLMMIAAVFPAIYLGTWRYDPARLEPLATKGQAEAQYRLGKCYFDGYGLQRDYHQAATWLRHAANQGHARAQAGLGLMYAQGLGMKKDYVEAAGLFRKAAEQGLALAENQLGMLYAEGKGVQRNLDEAAKWFSKAAGQGFAPSKTNLMLTTAARSRLALLLETRNGKSYRAAKVEKVESDGITVQFQPQQGGVGMAKVKFSDLPQDVQDLYGFSHGDLSTNNPGIYQLSCLLAQAQ